MHEKITISCDIPLFVNREPSDLLCTLVPSSLHNIIDRRRLADSFEVQTSLLNSPMTTGDAKIRTRLNRLRECAVLFVHLGDLTFTPLNCFVLKFDRSPMGKILNVSKLDGQMTKIMIRVKSKITICVENGSGRLCLYVLGT